MSRLQSALAILLAALPLAACKEEAKVVRYDAPKERPPATAPAAGGMTANAGLVAQTAGFGKPEWTAPAAWRAQPESPMRKGSWKTGPDGAEAEIAVTVFPGDVGGLSANVGRWCGQIGLAAPESPEALAKLTAPDRIDGNDATRVALVNEGKALTAVLLQKDGATWFFKVSGPEGAVSAARPEFDAFLASVKFPAAK